MQDFWVLWAPGILRIFLILLGLIILKRRNHSRSGAEIAEGKKNGSYGTWVGGVGWLIRELQRMRSGGGRYGAREGVFHVEHDFGKGW